MNKPTVPTNAPRPATPTKAKPEEQKDIKKPGFVRAEDLPPGALFR